MDFDATVHVADLTVSPDGRRLAFTSERRVAVLNLGDGELSPGASGSCPRWSPSGDRLAWITEDGRAFLDGPVDIPGTVESLAWSPDGRKLLLVVAEPGAELSDVFGSGRLPGDDDRPSWAPLVDDGGHGGGRRRAWIYDLAEASARCVSDANVWQAVWAGTRILCVTSPGPSESDWYGARLALLEPLTPLLETEDQVAVPAASPSGERLSAVVGAMSDRGLYVGQLTIVGHGVVDTGGVDVTDQAWLDEDRVIFAGLRGLDTVVGIFHLGTGTVEVLWESEQTCGDYLPAVSAGGGVVAAVVHSYSSPPAIALIAGGKAVPCLEPNAHLPDAVGTLEPVHWTAPDGTPVSGLLALPPGAGPYALVVHVHGGPVWAWRDEWAMHGPYTPLLVGGGYAVLHVNMRGSAGHGQEFIRAGLLDMGGADASDFTSGVDALVAAGLVDPARVGITGNSYGGFMAAWLAATTDRFAAVVARSPVTDWVSQHHASNLPGFDRRCLSGDPLDAASAYRARSPLYLADQVRAPMMLMAGAQDLATPPEQAAMFHRALIEHGRASTLVIYPEEGHGVRQQAALADQCARMLAFFDRHMPAVGRDWAGE
ncbi:S9 family peptidase [Nonomuraea sp. NPDC050556]|uniref:S9 family peptidase n=1 Tax=Nonomuraea sp. NPDC050556 TaxID=3364369 RepID=UPI0037A8CC09